MKKLITLFLAFTIVMTCFAGVSADSVGLLRGMNVLPELTERADTDYVRRDEFAAVASVLLGFEETQPDVTPFADVSEDNVYGSAIRRVKDSNVMNGVNAYEFAPSSTITFRDAIVVFIRILGYQILADSKGGYPGGYIQAATGLKLFNRVSKPLDSMLTFADLWEMTDWAMETAVAESNYTMSEGTLAEEISINKNAPTLLEKNLGYTKYKAVVDEIVGDEHSAKVTITENDERGNAKYKAGHTLTLKAALTVNIAAYDKAPVYIWINDNDELKHITLMENCEIIYGTVYSVNRDSNAKSGYNTESIKEIAFWDINKDFKADDEGIVFYKNDVKVNGKIALTDKYVRAVIKDGKITALETWDFKDGGIVSEINFKSVVFSRGDITEAINGLGEFKKTILILNGKMRDIKELKTGTLIDYYISDDKQNLIILASERKHADIFEGLSDDEMQIGSVLVKTAQTVYTYSADNGYYIEGGLDELLGSRVTAYVDSFGKVRYVSPEGDIQKDSFIGYLIGVDAGKGLDNQKELYIANLDDDAFPKKAYKLSESVIYENPSDNFAELGKNSDSRSAKSIYRFKTNSKDEVIKIGRLSPYFGYTLDADGYVSAAVSGQYASKGDPTYFEINSKRLYFSKNDKIVALYERDGEVAFGTTTYGELEEKYPSGTDTFTFFGEYMSSKLDLILLSGDISKLGGNTKSFGIISSVRTGIDKDGEKTSIVEIDGTRYIVDASDAASVAENTVVYYSKTVGGFASIDIDILDYMPLDGRFYEWEGTSNGGNINIVRGTVAKVDSKRIFIEDQNGNPDAFFFNTNGCKYMAYDESTSKFEDGSSTDFLQGKDVLYILTANQMVSIVFYLK